MINLKKVAIDDLVEGMISNQTVCNDRGTILVVQGVSLTQSIITRLKNFEIDFIDILDEGDEKESSEAPSGIPDFTPQKVISAVRDLTDNIVDLRAVTIKKNNVAAIEECILLALHKPFVEKLFAACANDEILYKHSLRTTIFSINMGLAKRYDAARLEQLAICALLHDCGMEKKFRESDVEHPLQGFMKLRDNPEIDMGIALVCLQHHEHYDGSGFPFGFSRTQISELSLLLAVADHYDRLLIRNNDPRKAMFKTIEKKNTFFAPDMIDLFGSTIDWSRLYNIPKELPDKEKIHQQK